MTYTIHRTDLNQPTIQIEEASKDNSTDITLFGRLKLEYGKELNENVLHVLENFACNEAAGSTISTATPDLTKNGNSLTLPSEGQIWYNSSRELLYYWNGTKWYPLGARGNYNANWGQINDGQQLPKPVNPYTNEAYDYSECIWVVTPATIPKAYTYMICTTDNQAVVNMKYRGYGESVLTSGTANFLIISIKGNINSGTLIDGATPAISPSPTPTPTPTNNPSPTPQATPSPSSSPGASPTPNPSPTSTPAVTRTSTPVPSQTGTPAPTSTRTPTPVPSPSAPSACDRCTAAGTNCCVSIDSHLPDGKLAGEIVVGDTMMLADETSLAPFVDTVTYSEPSLQESVRITTKNGAVLDCSLTAPIPTKEGIVLAPNVMSKFVAVNIDEKSYWDEVVQVLPLGEIWVQHITVNNKSFWAGKNKNSYILHHNIKCCYCADENSGCVWVGPNCCDCP